MLVGDIENLPAEFAGEQERIRTLRSLDPEFDEICSGYVELYRELAALERIVGADLNHAIDLRESLDGLRWEIERALHSSKLNPAQRKGPKK